VQKLKKILEDGGVLAGEGKKRSSDIEAFRRDGGGRSSQRKKAQHFVKSCEKPIKLL
jgi:hypothetical protein